MHVVNNSILVALPTEPRPNEDFCIKAPLRFEKNFGVGFCKTAVLWRECVAPLYGMRRFVLDPVLSFGKEIPRLKNYQKYNEFAIATEDLADIRSGQKQHPAKFFPKLSSSSNYDLKIDLDEMNKSAIYNNIGENLGITNPIREGF